MSIKATQPEDSAVHVEAVATIVRRNGELEIDWLIEGGISALECEGVVLYTAERPITDDDGSGEVYLATPSPQPAEAVQAEPVAHLRAEANMFNGYGACHKDDVNAFPVYRSAKAEPAEAKTAAVDGMTDEQINRAFLATIEAHPGELSLTALPALSFFARAIRAAIATQEGGQNPALERMARIDDELGEQP